MADDGAPLVELLGPLLSASDSTPALADVLREVVRVSMSATGARHGSLGLLDDTGEVLSELVDASGPGASSLHAGDEHDAGAVPDGLMQLLVEARPMVVADVGAEPSHYGLSETTTEAALIVAPVVGDDRVIGYLRLADRHDGGEFADRDLELATGFAAVASVAVEIARLRTASDGSRLVAAEHSNNALREDAVQRLFAASLWVETAARESTQPEVAERLTTVMAHLDGVMEQLRPRSPRPVAAASDLVPPDDLADRLAVILSEALTKIVPPSGEATIQIRVSLRSGRLDVDVLEVLDEGVPVSPVPDGRAELDASVGHLDEPYER